MTGLELLEKYQEYINMSNGVNINKDLFIIGMSATASPEEQNIGFLRGMHCFCPKPIDTKLLQLILKQLKVFYNYLKNTKSQKDLSFTDNYFNFKSYYCHLVIDSIIQLEQTSVKDRSKIVFNPSYFNF